MADEPTITTTQAADALGNFLSPLEPLIAWHKQLKESGGLERAANEAHSRAQAAQRDLVDLQAASDTASSKAKADTLAANKAVAAATLQAKNVVDAATAKASEITAAAQSQADTVIAKANDELHTIEGQTVKAKADQAEAQKALDAVNAQLAEAQEHMSSLKARLG